MIMPAIFLGHRSPMNAITENPYAPPLATLAAAIPKPTSFLVISAHWKIPLPVATAGAHPRTIHDFGGFPRALFEVQYPAPGSDALGARIGELLQPDGVVKDTD